jgi:iron-sulfur cluster assembly protein
MATTQQPTQQPTFTLTLSPRAAEEVRRFMVEEKVPAETAGLRIGVMPGGCSGFRYSLNLEEKALDDDIVIESSGVRLFVDEFSSQHLNGVNIDYKSNFQESGFAFENPNATGGCGCGSSFTV